MLKKEFKIFGTTCQSCKQLIEESLKELDGVNSINFNLKKEIAEIRFDSQKISLDKIFEKIKELGYEPKNSAVSSSKKSYTINLPKKKFFGFTFGIIGFLIIAYFLFGFVETIELPQISQNMGYGLLFLVGILTGFHCVSMCGGFVVSYSTKYAKQNKKVGNAHFMYGLGKLVSYTVIGAAFGLLGSIIAFTPKIRGIAGLLAGLFLVIFGLKMLNLFPALRGFQLKTPGFISKFIRSKNNRSPLIIGLLNGLMIACGPLQAIYIMAAGTGSVLEGAKLLFVFGLGTLPVMLGFGYFTSFISNKATHKILKFSGLVVIVLGVLMINNGLVLTGSGYDAGSILSSVRAESENIESSNIAVQKRNYQEIRMEVNRYGWSPDKFVLKKGVPVKWIIEGVEINGCNNAIQVPKYNLEFDVKKGTQVIEFTPKEEETIRWSCWMGMIPGSFIVKEDLSSASDLKKELDSVKMVGGSCGSGCGCGG